MSLIKKLAGEAVIYGGSSILSRLLNYVVMTFYLIRVFKTGEYGVVSEMYTYAGLMMVLFTYRMETTFFRFGSEKGQKENTFSTASLSLLVTTAIFTTLLLLLTQPIADSLAYPNNPEYVRWFIFILAFDTLAAIPFARLRLDNRPIRFAVLKTINILVNIFFIFFFLGICPRLLANGWEGIRTIYNPDNQIVYVFVANFCGSLVVFLMLLPSYRKLKFSFDTLLWKKMLLYTFPLVIVGLAAVTNSFINLPLLKYYLPYDLETNKSLMGIYSACFKLAILMSLFIQAFNYAAEPFFFRNANRKDSKVIYAQVGQAFALVGSLVFLGLSLYLDVIQFLLPDAYREAIPAVPIVAMAFLFLGLYYNFSIWYKLSDRTIFGAYISVAGAIITIILNIFLIPKIGYYGSAWAALACYGFMAMVSYWIGKKYYPIPYPLAKMFGYIGLAVLVFLIANGLRPLLTTTISVLCVNTLLIISYLAMIWIWEKETIKRMLKG